MKKRTGLIFILSFAVLCLLFPQESEKTRAEDILSMSLEELLNTDVVSALKIPQKIKEVPAIVRVITANQIKERGYFVLEEALADLPGFNFRNILGFNSYSFMRGAPNQNNLILLLIDGIQVNELNSGGFYEGGQYNLSNVDRIEVVYSPASALYGTNTVSRIINIITKKPEGKGNRHIGGLVGSFATTNLDFAYDYLNKQKNPKIIESSGTNIVDDAFVFHTNISFLDFHNFDIHFTVNNLFNTKYFHSSKSYSFQVQATPEKDSNQVKLFFLKIKIHYLLANLLKIE